MRIDTTYKTIEKENIVFKRIKIKRKKKLKSNAIYDINRIL